MQLHQQKNPELVFILLFFFFLNLTSFFIGLKILFGYNFSDKNVVKDDKMAFSVFSPSQNASQFKNYFKESQMDNWQEWRYANFKDQDSDLRGFFMFYGQGDLSKSDKGRAGVYINLHSKDFGDFYLSRSFRADRYSDSGDFSNFSINDNNHKTNFFMEADNSDNYKVKIQNTGDTTEEIEVDLTYKRITKGFMVDNVSFSAIDQINNNDWMSWVVPMPYAYVTGTIKHKGKEINIRNATGYMDHNFGFWVGDDMKWDWNQFNDMQKKISISTIKTEFSRQGNNSENKGFLVITDEKGIRVKANDIDFSYEPLKDKGIRHPDNIKVFARNKDNKVDIHVKCINRYDSFLNDCDSLASGAIRSQEVLSFKELFGFSEHRDFTLPNSAQESN